MNRPEDEVLGPIQDIHFTDGRRAAFADLTLDEVRGLASGALRMVGQLPSSAEVFRMLADEMEHFGRKRIGDAGPVVTVSYATMLGLVQMSPEHQEQFGDFDQTWRVLYNVPTPESEVPHGAEVPGEMATQLLERAAETAKLSAGLLQLANELEGPLSEGVGREGFALALMSDRLARLAGQLGNSA